MPGMWIYTAERNHIQCMLCELNRAIHLIHMTLYIKRVGKLAQNHLRIESYRYISSGIILKYRVLVRKKVGNDHIRINVYMQSIQCQFN